MASEPRTTGLTYDDLLRMFPEEDLVRRELIDGELFVTPSPVTRHQRVVAELVTELHLYAREHGGEVFPAPLDVVLSDTNVVQPDVLFVRDPSRIGERNLAVAPDLAVEVSSTSTSARDLGRKKDLYARFGVPEYWFVDLDADRIEVHRLEEGAYRDPGVVGRGERLTTPLLRGLSLDADRVLG